MAEKITAYKASDGTLYEKEVDADNHSKVFELNKELDYFFDNYGCLNMSGKAVLGMIKEHSHNMALIFKRYLDK